MGYYLDTAGTYYEGDQEKPWHAVVPHRPHYLATWNGSQWVVPSAASIQDTQAQQAVDAEERLHFEMHFDIENRVRALEGKQPITRAVYRDALITRWKQLNP